MGEAKRKREQVARQPLPMLRATTPRGPKRISADDAAYLRKVRAGVDEAVRLERQATQLEQQAAELRRQAVARYGAHASVAELICEKYGLNIETDEIDPSTGTITRAPALNLVPDAGPPAAPTASLKPPRPKQPSEGVPPAETGGP